MKVSADVMARAVWEECCEWGEYKTDSTLVNWLCQTGLELRNAVSYCTGDSSCLGSAEVCAEYTKHTCPISFLFSSSANIDVWNNNIVRLFVFFLSPL
jgi:hypothetical protein